MILFIKTKLQYLYKYKKYIFLLGLFIILFFSLRFPWGSLFKKIIKDVQKNQNFASQIYFENASFKFFPPRIELENVSIYLDNKSFTLDKLSLSLLFSKWLAFTPAWHVKIQKSQSFLYIDFWNHTSKANPEQHVVSYTIKAISPFIDLSLLQDLFPNVKLSGQARLNINFKGNLDLPADIRANIQAQGQNIQLYNTEFQSSLGPMQIPSTRWTSMQLKAHIKDGELLFKTFHLGKSPDSLIVRLKGSSSLKKTYKSIFLNSYNFKIQIDVDKRKPIKLFKVFFADYVQDKQAFVRYQLRMIGKGRDVPHTENLKEF